MTTCAQAAQGPGPQRDPDPEGEPDPRGDPGPEGPGEPDDHSVHSDHGGRNNSRELKFKIPDSFDRTPKKLRRFIGACLLYLQANRGVYDTDEKKIMFVLTLMDKGTATDWTKGFLLHASEEGNFDTYVFPTFQRFLQLLRGLSKTPM
jgi:hypothetical protein